MSGMMSPYFLLVFLICGVAFAGGKKFSPVTTLLPVLASSSIRAFLATAPPRLLALAFSVSPVAASLSAIYLVDNSANAVKISSASLMWSRRFWVLSPFKFLWPITLKPVHS